MIKYLLPAVMAMAFAGTAVAAPAKVTLVGGFSNVVYSRSEDPHALSGYSVSLYRHKNVLFGEVGVAVGSMELATGRMSDIKLDPVTNALTFTVKYSSGIEMGPGIAKGGREAREVLLFSGTMTPKALVGTMETRDGYRQAMPGKKKNVAIKRSRDDFVPASLEEWEEYRTPAPKW